jgi:hypothetical protein
MLNTFSALAQQAPTATSAEVPHWSLALGTDPFELNLSSREPGTKGQILGTLSRDWARPTSQFGVRAQLLFGKDLPRGQRFTGGNCTPTDPACEINLSREFVGLTAALTREWRRNSGLRPYLVGGPGLYLEQTDANAKDQLLLAPAFLPPTGTHLSLGVMGGAGLSFKVGHTNLFIEQAFHLSEALSTRRGGALISHPLSVGFRF